MNDHHEGVPRSSKSDQFTNQTKECRRKETNHSSDHDDNRRRMVNSHEDVVSIISSDTLTVLRKRFHFPNDMVICLPSKTDRAHLSPPGFFTVYDMTLRAGLRFPPAPELLEIFSTCGFSPAQLSYRAMSIIVGLMVFYREHKAVLIVEHLLRLCRFSCDHFNRISCKSIRKWANLTTHDPPKNWSSQYFFVKNDWGFSERWERMKELPSPLHSGIEDILQTLKIPNLDTLRYELHYVGQFLTEERLFKNYLSIHAGRSHAIPLGNKIVDKGQALSKRSSPMKFDNVASKKSKVDKSNILMKVKKASDVDVSMKGRKVDKADAHALDVPLLVKNSTSNLDNLASLDKVGQQSVPVIPDRGLSCLSGIRIPDEILKRICTGRRRSDELILRKMEIEAELDIILTEWNQEFVKIKYQCGEGIRRWKAEIEESSSLKDQLSQCRAEMALMATSLSLKQQELDRSHDELVTIQAEKICLESGQKALEEEKQKLQNLLHLKESEVTTEMKSTSIKAVEDFKSSIEYRLEIQDHVEGARRSFHKVESKELKQQFLEEGFTRGFLKGTRLVHRKTGAIVDGISMSDVSQDELLSSDDSSSDSSSDDASSEEIDILSL